MNTNFNLLNMLEGEVNIDHNKVKTWRFLDNSGKPEYFSKEELEIVFSSYLEEMENIIEDYEGQGEQSAEIWFEEAQSRGIIERDFISVDCKKTYPVKFEDQIGKMYVK